MVQDRGTKSGSRQGRANRAQLLFTYPHLPIQQISDCPLSARHGFKTGRYNAGDRALVPTKLTALNKQVQLTIQVLCHLNPCQKELTQPSGLRQTE